MSDIVQSCGNGPPSSNICEKIRQKIDDLINRDKRACGNSGTHGLKHRFSEQINGKNGPGTTSWNNHEGNIKQQQKALLRQLQKLIDNSCGPPPPGANSWARRPVPTPEQWRGPADGEGVSAAEAAAYGAGGLTLGYVVYRIIRFLPSLLPPAWETIPANLAIP